MFINFLDSFLSNQHIFKNYLNFQNSNYSYSGFSKFLDGDIVKFKHHSDLFYVVNFSFYSCGKVIYNISNSKFSFFVEESLLDVYRF